MKQNKRYLADSKAFLKLAETQMEYAAWDLQGGFYDPVCFWSHQIGEKALKSYLFYLGVGLIKKHRLAEQVLPEVLKFDKEAEKLKEAGEFLDQFFIPTRYGGPERPMGGFTKEDGGKAFDYAKEILDFVKRKIKKERS